MLLAEPLHQLLGQLRLAARTLLASPAFSLTVIVTLALGIGANTAVFSAIDAVLLKPLPYPNADRLVLVEQHQREVAGTIVAPVRYADWARASITFDALTGYYTQDESELSGALPERLKRAVVAPDFLETWGIAPAIGRDFSEDEHHFGGPSAVLISDRFWRRRFHSDPSAVGKQLRFGATPFTIAGVMPASFLFSDRDVDLWSPAFLDAPFAQSRTSTWFTVIGRMKPGVTAEQAQANLASIQTTLGRQHGLPDSEITVSVQPLKDSAVGETRQSLWMVFGAASVLLLIACTNIAALLLARAAQREHEVAVRYSLGATRGSIAWQVLSEAFVLSIAGALLGLGLAAAATRVFSTLAANLPRIDEITLDSRLLLYTLGCAVATTLLCGLMPALRSSRQNPREGLGQAGRTQVSGRGSMQWVLVGVQVALAVTLLAGAGLLLRSLQQLGQVPLGFDKEHLLTFRITASWGENRDWSTRAREHLEAVPGVVRAATMFDAYPGVPSKFAVELTIEGRQDPGKIMASGRAVSAGYFEALGIPLLKGELCRDEINPHPFPGMVNRRFAQTFFPDGDPIGHIVRFPGQDGIRVRVMGIVADSRDSGVDKNPEPMVYPCYGGGAPSALYVVRTRSDPAAMTETIRRELQGVEPMRSAFDLAPLESRIDDAFAENRLRTVLLTFFAMTAVVLASVGLYGTLSYFVSLRRREVGLRLALGAGRGRIVRQFVTRGLMVAGLGCAAGIALALAFTRVLAGMLFGVAPDDPLTLSGVIGLMIAVAGLASLLPAARAAVLEPMRVLREE